MIFRGPAPAKLYQPTCSDAALSNKKENSDLENADTFKYAPEGVIRSEDIWAKIMTKFGAFGSPVALERTSRAVSKVG
jgi:hypothetical protein